MSIRSVFNRQFVVKLIQEVEKPPAEPTREEQLQSQLSQQLNLPSLQDSSAAVNPKPQPPEDKVFATTSIT